MVSVPGVYKSKMGPSSHGANKTHAQASNEQKIDDHQSEQRVKPPATSRGAINDSLQKSSEGFNTINPAPVVMDTLQTQPPANKCNIKNEGNPNYLFNEIDEALKKGNPIKSTATEGNFGSTPNSISCPFKTSTDTSKSSREEHVGEITNTHSLCHPEMEKNFKTRCPRQ